MSQAVNLSSTISIDLQRSTNPPKSAAALPFKPDPILTKLESEMTFWKRFKLCCQRKTALVTSLKQLADAKTLNEQWQTTFITALASKDFAIHRIFLRVIVMKLPPENLKTLITTVQEDALKALSIELLSKFSTLVTQEEIAKALQIPETFDIHNQAKTTLESQEKLKQTTEVSRRLPGIIRVLHSIVDTVLMAFSFFEFGKEPGSSWEASHMLKVYGQMFAFPFTIITMLNALLLSPVTAVVLSLILCTTLITLIVIYVKWFKPPPEHLTLCKNLTAEARDGNLNHVVINDEILSKMKAAFDISSQDVRRHPVVIGLSGAGKSTMFEALALFLHKTKSRFTVYKIDAAKLVPTGSAYEEDKPQKILDRIGIKHKQNVILCFEEFEAALEHKVMNKALLSFFDKDGFPYCSAAITESGFKKYIESDVKGWKRRTHAVKVPSADRTTTIAILKNMVERNAQDLEITTKHLNDIYDNTQLHTLPDKAKVVLASAIVKMREQRKKIDDSKLLQTQSRLRQIRTEMIKFPSHDIYMELEKELKAKKQEEIKLKTDKEADEAKMNALNQLMEFKTQQKKMLDFLAQKLAKEGLKHNGEACSLFTLIYFSLLPEVQKKIQEHNPYTFQQALEAVYKEESLKKEEDVQQNSVNVSASIIGDNVTKTPANPSGQIISVNQEADLIFR